MATARTNSFSATFDTAPVERLAGRIQALADRVLLRLSAVDAVNEVVTRFDAVARKGMNAGLNLSDDYIATRMKVTRAASTGSGTVRAEITARGPDKAGGLTIIGHYPHAQSRVAGTALRKGPSRGLRPSGVGVEIKKGQAEFEPQWFTMRLKQGTQAGDKVGLFVRTTASGGKPVHLYGPSPYSLFRHQIETRQDDLNADLAATAAAHAAAAIERALA